MDENFKRISENINILNNFLENILSAWKNVMVLYICIQRKHIYKLTSSMFHIYIFFYFAVYLFENFPKSADYYLNFVGLSVHT